MKLYNEKMNERTTKDFRVTKIIIERERERERERENWRNQRTVCSRNDMHGSDAHHVTQFRPITSNHISFVTWQ